MGMIYQYVGHFTTCEGQIFHMNTSHVRLSTICLVRSKTGYHGNKGTGYYETSDLCKHIESSDVVYRYIIAVDLDINLYFWLPWQQNEKLLSQSFEVITRYTSELVSSFCTTHLCHVIYKLPFL